MRVVFAILMTLLLAAGCYVPAPAIAPGVTAANAGASATTIAPAVATTEPRVEQVTLAMGYIPSVQFAPLYVAQEKGYFADAGLEVTFRYGYETDLLKLVASGEIPFLVGSGEEVILGRSQGLPVRSVLRWYRRFPVVLFAKASSGITTPSDLVGKRVGIPGLFGASYVGWEAILYATGLDASKVSLQSIGFTQAAAISQNQVDAALDYVVNGPVQLHLAGEPVVVMPVYEYVDLPSNGIITSDVVIEKRPDLVRSLVTAVLHGLSDTLEDPDGAFETSVRVVPGAGDTQAVVSRAIFDESLKLWQAEPGQLGKWDSDMWEQAASFMLEMGLIQKPVDSAELYSNDFVTDWK